MEAQEKPHIDSDSTSQELPKDSKPAAREFWIQKDAKWHLGTFDIDGKGQFHDACTIARNPDDIHVVEYTAYDQLLLAVNKWMDSHYKAAQELTALYEKLEPNENTLESAFGEIDYLRDLEQIVGKNAAELTAVKAELYEQKIKYDRLEFTHQNTFNHWHQAMNERDALKLTAGKYREALESMSFYACGICEENHKIVGEALK